MRAAIAQCAAERVVILALIALVSGPSVHRRTRRIPDLALIDPAGRDEPTEREEQAVDRVVARAERCRRELLARVIERAHAVAAGAIVRRSETVGINSFGAVSDVGTWLTFATSRKSLDPRGR